jgi:hypothetical protein
MKINFPVLFITISIMVPVSLQAQQADSIEPHQKAVHAVLANENLNKFGDNPPVFYSSGFQVRTKALQQLFHSCIDYYESAFPGTKFNVDIYILNKSDWDNPHTGLPYGMPFYNPDDKILFIPAEKNALRRLSGLPDDPEKSDSVLSTFDFQPIHELGHYYFFTIHHINKEKWLNEFLATYFLICFIKEKNLAPTLEKDLQANYPVQHKSLDDFQKIYLGVGPANYHWYQSKFATLGFSLYPQFKEKLISLMLQNYSPGGKNLDGLTLLKTLAPEKMNAWLKEMQ